MREASTGYGSITRWLCIRCNHREKWQRRIKASVFHRRLNASRPRQNGRHLPDDIFKCIFLNKSAQISIKISLKFVPESTIDKIPALVQIMACRRPGDKPLSEPMMVSSPTHIWVPRSQWVKTEAASPSVCNTKLVSTVVRHIFEKWLQNVNQSYIWYIVAWCWNLVDWAGPSRWFDTFSIENFVIIIIEIITS